MPHKVPTPAPKKAPAAFQPNDRIRLGVKVRDKLTGFSGIATGFCEYISGCNQVLIAPPIDKDGKWVDGHWFDIQRLEILDDPVVTLDNGTTPGFDMAAPVK